MQQTFLFESVSNKIYMESIEFGFMRRRVFWFLSSVAPVKQLRVWAKPSQPNMHIILLAYF